MAVNQHLADDFRANAWPPVVLPLEGRERDPFREARRLVTSLLVSGTAPGALVRTNEPSRLVLGPEPSIERQWRAFLDQLPSVGFSDQHVLGVREFWQRLRQSLPWIDVPRAASSEDGAILQLVWDCDTHHLDVDVLRDGTTEWFYLDRKTGRTDSGDTPAGAHAYLASSFRRA